MIQANELRLYNWVYSIEIGDNVQISAISEDGFSFKNCVTWDYPNIEEIHPIPLTEEILLKCGFEKLGKYTFVCDNALMQLEIDVVTNKLVHSILAIEVKYLHKLQNLYYFLCGEELEINL